MKLTIIAARATNGVIGNKGTLPWKLPADLEHFKKTTMGKPIIMGRKTYESIGRPLPGRMNVVLTTDQAPIEGVYKCSSMAEAIELISHKYDEVFIIGGAALYQMAIPYAKSMIITEVLEKAEGDTYFPQFDIGDWKVDHSPAPFLDNGTWCSISHYERIKEDHKTIPRLPYELSFAAMMGMAMAMATHRVRQRSKELKNKE